MTIQEELDQIISTLTDIVEELKAEGNTRPMVNVLGTIRDKLFRIQESNAIVLQASVIPSTSIDKDSTLPPLKEKYRIIRAAAILNAKVAKLNAGVSGMNAENDTRKSLGESTAYDEDCYLKALEEAHIEQKDIDGLFNVES